MRYLNLNEALKIHDEIIDKTGGLKGYNPNSLGYLDSVLSNIKNDDFYPNLSGKIAHLMFSCVKFHPFNDGNKRSAIYICMHFLALNEMQITYFAELMEDIVIEIAENKLSKQDLTQIIENFLSQKGKP